MFSENIKIVARAVMISKEGKILLCQVKEKADWYFLPGGHVEFNESTESALIREVQEEMGITIKVKSMIGFVENRFLLSEKAQHELNIIFEIEEIESKSIKSKEAHIQFSFHDTKNLPDIDLLPKTLNDGIQKWLENRIFFWKKL